MHGARCPVLRRRTSLESSESVSEPSPTIRRACIFLDQVKDLLKEKNAKYGDSAANPMRVFSQASVREQILVRIDDKLSRIAKGAGYNEADEDTIADLVGYLALLRAVDTRVIQKDETNG